MKILHPLVEAFKAEFAKTPTWEEKLFNPPPTEEEILNFQKELKNLGLELPDVFYDFYRWHDGSKYGEYFLTNFHAGVSILSLSSILADKKSWDYHEDVDAFLEYEPGTWWNKAWIPFLYIQSWWVGVIDTAGCFGGKPGQILGFDFKSASGKDIRHESFAKWLETMLELKKNDLLLDKLDEQWYVITYQIEEEKIADTIVAEVNGDFPYFIDIWKYRRKDKPLNPYWENLRESISDDDLESVEELIQNGQIELNEQNLYEEEKYTPLLLAISQHSFDITKWIIEQNADLNLQDCYGFDPFRKLIFEYNNVKSYVTSTDVIVLAKLMLEKGYNVQKRNSNSNYLELLLDSAIYYLDEEMIRFCVEYGANINKKNYKEVTVLHDAVLKGKTAIIPLLLELGADKTAKSKDGKTAWDLYSQPLKALEIDLNFLEREEHQKVKQWLA